ncbi:MAG: hypothetical protein V7K54_21810 [Nostoc sp.]
MPTRQWFEQLERECDRIRHKSENFCRDVTYNVSIRVSGNASLIYGDV